MVNTEIEIEVPIPATPSGLIAPWWHTLAVISFYVALAMIGPTSMKNRSEMPHLALYVYAAMASWMYLSMAIAGIYHRRNFFVRTLRTNARAWGVECRRGILIYGGSALAYVSVFIALRGLNARPDVNTTSWSAMRPQTLFELLLWLCVSLSVGFCEEHVFRGYLLQQSIALLRGRKMNERLAVVVAVVCTSALFGVLHLYEGVGGAIYVGFLGLVSAFFALRYGNLRAVIVAHVLQDFVGSALSFLRHAGVPF